MNSGCAEFCPVYSNEEVKNIAAEFKRLKCTYLDHTGSALYCESIIKEISKDLSEVVYSNPHSNSTTSKATYDAIDQVRYKVLQHFNTSLDEYSVIFTSGTTGSLKLLIDSFLWENKFKTEWLPVERSHSKGKFVYLEDCHTSVLGMRETAERLGVKVINLAHDKAFEVFNKSNTNHSQSHKDKRKNSLFVFPAQCNFSGFKYPLNWIEKTQNGQLNSISGSEDICNWYCLLDAATYVSTNGLDLSNFKPDFVTISFYKIFGYPTGLGALLVKNTSANVLEKHYYGGGTVLIALSSRNSFVPRPVLHDKFEDGTLNFLSIISLRHCFSCFYNIVGTMDKVSRHTFALAQYMYYHLVRLHHSNGSPAVKIYSDSDYSDIGIQGAIINFNMLRPNGDFVGFVEVLNLANLHNIQLRTGCFCNPGACRRHLGLSLDDIKFQYESGHVCGDDKDLINGRPTGSVRISFGYYSTKSDIDKLLDLLKECFLQKPIIMKHPTHLHPKANDVNAPILINENSYVEATPTNQLNYGSAVLSHIFIYPVKSCGRLSVNTWEIDARGLKYDRCWMVVSASGVALTQKREPNLCLIRPLIDEQEGKLILTFPGYPQCSIPLNSNRHTKDAHMCQSKVCGDKIDGFDCGDEVATWLSTVLNQDGLRLLRQVPENTRAAKNSVLSLANQAQYLLINEASVLWLSDKIQTDECSKESMLDRFRSNFVVSGVSEAFIEQKWTRLNIGDTPFTVEGPCGRCQMICINQDTGVSSKEPLTSLAASLKGKLKFGIYLSQKGNGKVNLNKGDSIKCYYD